MIIEIDDNLSLNDKLEILLDKATSMRDDFLRKRGWKYITGPDCYWHWVKDFNGKQWSFQDAAGATRFEELNHD